MARGRSWVVGVVAAIGLGLIAAPVVFQMFDRAPKGAVMLADFKPLMTTPRLNGFQTDLRQIDDAVTELKGSSSPGYREFAGQWPTIHTDMKALLDSVQSNKANYDAVAALPSFRLFPWFFVAPGLILLVLAGLVWRGRLGIRAARASFVALGIGLVLAPVAFQMFTRAPKGGDMMTAFEHIETTQNVTRIQGYFGTMAAGQGAIRLEVVPALKLTAAQLATHYPATARLDDGWVHILNDMTPMIGAMSDNVVNYQAIKALPPFPLFPYFFLIPGVLVAGLALLLRPSQGAP